MWQVKPINARDLPALEALLHANPLRLSTLPPVRDQLAERIAAAQQGFAGLDSMATLLFGLHDEDDNLHGVCGIQPYAGGDEPFYSYRIDELVHASRHLGINQRQSVLYLSHELTGLTSLCSFSLTAALRPTPVFNLLSRSRLLYIAAHRHAFADELICEIQGIWDGAGQSLFWKSVGELFFGLDFITADHQCSLHGKTVIAELLPPYPIYTTLLPEAVQEAIGQAHPATQRTLNWLAHEGLAKTRFVDPFDAGPTFRGLLDELTSIKAIQTVSEVITGTVDQPQTYLVSQGEGADFRCVMLTGEVRDDRLFVTEPGAMARGTPSLILPLEPAAMRLPQEGV